MGSGHFAARMVDDAVFYGDDLGSKRFGKGGIARRDDDQRTCRRILELADKAFPLFFRKAHLRLVQKHDLRVLAHRACKREAPQLVFRELFGKAFPKLAQPRTLKGGICPLGSLAFGKTRQDKRGAHVFAKRGMGDKLVFLEGEPDIACDKSAALRIA